MRWSSLRAGCEAHQIAFPTPSISAELIETEVDDEEDFSPGAACRKLIFISQTPAFQMSAFDPDFYSGTLASSHITEQKAEKHTPPQGENQTRAGDS